MIALHILMSQDIMYPVSPSEVMLRCSSKVKKMPSWRTPGLRLTSCIQIIPTL